jgi:Transglycosylase SLT domain
VAGEIASAFVRIRPNMTGFQSGVESGVKQGFSNVSKIIGVAFTSVAFADIFKGAVSSAETYQATLRSVSLAITATGSDISAYRKQIDSLTSSGAALGYSQQDVLSGFRTMTLVTGNATDATKYMTLAEDIARARGLDLSTVSTAIGKAVDGKTASLQRYGIVATKGESVETLLAHAYQVYGGQAAANTTITEKLHATLANLEEAVGSALLPTVDKLLGHFDEWISKGDNTRKITDAVKSSMNALVTVVETVVPWIERGWHLLQSFSDTMGGLKATLEAATAGFVGYKLGLVAVGIAQTAMGATGVGALVAIRGALISTGIGALFVALGVAADLVITHWQAVKEFFENLWNELRSGFANLVSDIGGVLAQIPSWLPGVGKFHDWGVQMQNWAGSEGTSIGGILSSSMSAAILAGMPKKDQLTIAAEKNLPSSLPSSYGQSYIPGSTGLKSLAASAAKAAGVPVQQFLAQINKESGFNPTAVSSKGALGIAQFMPATARGYGINPLNPQQALPAAAKMMASLYAKYKNWGLALAAYNAGSGTVDKYLAGKLPGGLPSETTNYVQSILGSTANLPTPNGIYAQTPLSYGAPPPAKSTAAAIATAKSSLEEQYKKVVASAKDLGSQLTSQVKKDLGDVRTEITSISDKGDVTKAKANLTDLRTEVGNDLKKMKEEIALNNTFDGLKTQVAKLGTDVTPEVTAEMKKIQTEIGKVSTPQQIAGLKQQMTTVKNEIAAQLKQIQQNIANEKTQFDSAWQALAAGADSAFQAATTAGMNNLQTLTAAAQQAGLGSNLLGGALTQTPAEAALAQLQSAHDAAAAAAQLAADQAQLAADTSSNAAAVTAARDAYDSAAAAVDAAKNNATPDPATIKSAQDALANAAQALQDASDPGKNGAQVLADQATINEDLYQQQVTALTAQATLERNAANKQLTDAQNAYATQRNLLQQAMDQRVAIIEQGMLDGNLSAASGMQQLTSVLSDPSYAINMQNSGLAIGGALYKGLDQAINGPGGIHDLIAGLIKDMQAANLLPSGASNEFNTVGPSGLSATQALQVSNSLDPAALAAALKAANADVVAELQKQTDIAAAGTSITISDSQDANRIAKAVAR